MLEARADLLSDQARRLNQQAAGLERAATQLQTRQTLRRRAGQVERDPFGSMDGSKRFMIVRGANDTKARRARPGCRRQPRPRPSVERRPPPDRRPRPAGPARPETPPPTAGLAPHRPRRADAPADEPAARPAPAPTAGDSGGPGRSSTAEQLRRHRHAHQRQRDSAPGCCWIPATAAELRRIEAVAGAPASEAERLQRAAAALTRRAQALEAEARALRTRAQKR